MARGTLSSHYLLPFLQQLHHTLVQNIVIYDQDFQLWDRFMARLSVRSEIHNEAYLHVMNNLAFRFKGKCSGEPYSDQLRNRLKGYSLPDCPIHDVKHQQRLPGQGGLTIM